MSEDKLLHELEKKRESNLLELKKVLGDTFNYQKLENIGAVKHGVNAGRSINLKAKILSALCKQKVTRNNIDTLLFDFDSFDFFIHGGFFILRINNRSKK